MHISVLDWFQPAALYLSCIFGNIFFGGWEDSPLATLTCRPEFRSPAHGDRWVLEAHLPPA